MLTAADSAPDNVDHLPFVVPLVLALLGLALVGGVLTLGSWFLAGLGWLPLFILTACLEAVYTTLWLHRPAQRLSNRALLRLGELLGLAVCLRLLTWATIGNWPASADWRAFLLNPLLFFDAWFAFSLLLTIFAWTQANLWARLLVDVQWGLAEAAAVGQMRLGGRAELTESVSDLDSSAVVNRLAQSWVVGGIFLLFTTAVATLNLPDFTWQTSLRQLGRRPAPDLLVLGLLFYFLAGLWLISWARYKSYQRRWLMGAVHLQPQLETRWRRNALTLLGLIGLAAAFLPIGSTFAIARLIGVIFNLTVSLFNTLLALLAYFLAWLTSFLPFSSGGDAPTPEPTPLLAPTPAAGAGPDLALPNVSAQLFGGLLFWLVLLAITLIAVAIFLRERGYRLPWSTWRAWYQALRDALRALFRRVQGGATRLVQRLTAREVSAPEQAASRPRRLVRFNQMSPREQVRYFYLSVVERAARQGVIRQRAQTPLEYVESLQSQWPEAGPDVEALTQAFVQARYSRRPVSSDDVGPIRAIWQRVRAALRKA